MKILHVVYSCYPGSYRGGISKVVFELSRAQVSAGHDVTVFTLNRNSGVPISVPLEEEVVVDGVKIFYFPVDGGRKYSSRILRSALVANVQFFDVLHSHNTFLPLNRYVSSCAGKSGTPVFYHVHGALDPVVVRKGFLKSLKKRLYIRFVEGRVFQRAAGIFVFTEQEKKQVRHWGISSPCLILPNGIGDVGPAEAGAEAEVRKKFNIDSHSIVLYVGRLNPKKGIHVLIEAFGIVARRVVDAVLLIAGSRDDDPCYVESLDRLVIKHDLEDRLFWAGFVDERRKAALFEVASVFSHVSESEGMALSILEAMSVGLPVVVGEGCYMDHARNEGAIIECDFNSDVLAEELCRLLGDACKRDVIGGAAREYIGKFHSWDNIAASACEFYQSQRG